MWLAASIAAGLALSLVAGLVAFRRSSGERLDKWCAALLPLAFLLLGLVYASYVARTPHWDWNAARVAPPVALAQGFELYAGPDSGAIMTTLYGPVKEVLYLPSALASTPTGAMMIAGTLNTAWILGPLLALHLMVASPRPLSRAPHSRTPHSRTRHTRALAGFLFVASALLVAGSTHYMATKIHVDAPAVGLALLSCGLLMAPGAPGGRRLAAAAALSVLAAFTKQVEAPLAGAQVVYLAVAYGRRAAGLFVAWSAVAVAATGALFVALFGFEGQFYNVVTVPGAHRWIGGPTWFLISFVELLSASSFALLIVLLALRARAPAKGGLGGLFRDRPWILLVLVAVFLAPTAILGRTIVGGSPNSYHPVYFLLTAASMVLARGELFPGHPVRGARLTCAAAAVSLAVVLPQFDPDPILHLRENPQEQAYHFARAHPETAYFPWNQLSTLMAEGRLDHFDYGVRDRGIAGLSISDEHFRAHLPRKLRYVLFHESALDRAVMSFLPEFSHQTTRADMPGWIVYVRGEDARESP